ncbi:MAG TPA: sugar ABC transporter ATP-binding protein [Mesorhizobium sp.]
MSDTIRLVLKGIRKTYDASTVLDLSNSEDVVFRQGEIHGLAGENGAGKSTLVKVVCGLVSPTIGSMELDGKPYAPTNLAEARAAGVEIVLQEPGLVPGLTVADNLFLGRERIYSRFRILNGRRRDELARNALGRVGATTPINKRAGDLDLESQKFVELARALAFEPRVLVIDEMSASLTKQGVVRMSRVLREAAAQGTAILYISHYLEETFDLCQQVTVLKDGRHVQTLATDKLDESHLQTLMVGRSLVSELYHEGSRAAPAELAAPALKISGLKAGRAVRDFSLDVKAGEIVGLGGLVGCGSEEIAHAIFGVGRMADGEITLSGNPYRPSSSRHAIDSGVGFVSGDREANDLLLQATIQDNIALPTLPMRSNWGLTSRRGDAAEASKVIRELSIACRGPADYPAKLSGGNRQKVVLGKWMLRRPNVLVLQNPTRGVDVGAKLLIYSTLRRLAGMGTAILLISDELNELRGMSDRIVIMRRGMIAGWFDASANPSEEELVACMV